jgi:Fanconi anemia group J protein
LYPRWCGLRNGSWRFWPVQLLSLKDELGRLALSVCQTIPHGVLCFLPSYSLLEKLVTRWQDTGLWQHLSNYKTIVCESRDSRDFEETLKSFYSAIEDSVK